MLPGLQPEAALRGCVKIRLLETRLAAVTKKPQPDALQNKYPLDDSRMPLKDSKGIEAGHTYSTDLRLALRVPAAEPGKLAFAGTYSVALASLPRQQRVS